MRTVSSSPPDTRAVLAQALKKVTEAHNQSQRDNELYKCYETFIRENGLEGQPERLLTRSEFLFANGNRHNERPADNLGHIMENGIKKGCLVRELTSGNIYRVRAISIDCRLILDPVSCIKKPGGNKSPCYSPKGYTLHPA